MTFAYCRWHSIANAEIPSFNINSSGLRLIRRRYEEGRTSQKSRMPGLKEYEHAKKEGVYVGEQRPGVGVEARRPSSPHETQAEVDEALRASTMPSSPHIEEYGSNIPFSSMGAEDIGAEPTGGVSGEPVHSAERAECPQPEIPEGGSPPQQSAKATPEEDIPTTESTGPAEEPRASSPRQRSLKRTGFPRKKLVVKRPRREAPLESDTGAESGGDDDIPLSQLQARWSAGASAIVERATDDIPTAEGTTVDPEPRVSTSMPTASGAPPTSSAMVIVPTSTASQPEATPSTATPSSFDLSKDYGVSMIRNNFLAILRESPVQVLDHGGDFAGIKAVLEPLLDVMQSLTSAMATLPYRTQLMKVEDLFAKLASRRGQSLHRLIEDRTMQLVRERDDSQFELERQILEKKQKVAELGQATTTLLDKKKRIADAERNQQLLVESHKAALADIQAKLAEAESELKATTEKHQALTAEWAEHQTLVQVQSDDLEKLSDAVSHMQVLSDEDLRRRATEEVEATHQESIAQLVNEVRQAVDHM